VALRIGLVGYKGLFPELPPSARFRQYAELFSTVELPQTRNRIPEKELVLRWARRAPEGFVYSFQAPKYLTYRPSGDERRTLRKFLRRHRLLGPHRGGVRFSLPADLEPAAFQEWLSMLAELELPGEYAFEGLPELETLALEAGHAAVHLQEGPFLYLIEPEDPPLEARGYAYFHDLKRALRYSTRAQGGTSTNQTR